MLHRLIIKTSGGLWKARSSIAKSKKGIAWRILKNAYYRYLHEYGSYIGHTAKIGGVPVFPHGMYGVFISGSARMGKNCVLFQQVTIGSNTIPGSKGCGAPVIGDNCYFGAGAKVIGNVRVGNNCRIGANCVVTKDVPDNSLVVLPQPVIRERELLDNRYYSLHPEKGWAYYDDGKWVKETDGQVLEKLEKMMP
jgi:serine O-acetyltransferase